MEISDVHGPGLPEKEDVDIHLKPEGLPELLAVASTMLGILLFSGVIFGWAPLQVLLEEDGVYLDLCPKDNPLCNERLSRLIFLFTVGSTSSMVFCVAAGFLIDRAGPFVNSVLSGLITASGLFLIGAAPASSTEGNHFDTMAAGIILMGMGGSLVMMNSMPLAFIVRTKHMPLVMTLANTFFDASGALFLPFYALYTRLGISRRDLFFGYAGICLVVHLVLCISWLCGPLKRLYATKAAEGVQKENSESEQAVRPPLHGLSLLKQMMRFEFLFTLLFMTLHQFRANAYLGTNKLLLESLGDADTGYAYTQIFAITLPAATVCVPVISYSLRRGGFGRTYIVVTILAGIWNALTLIPSLPLQVVTFLSFTTFRAFFYSAHFTYISHTFGSRTNGTILGIVATFSGCVNFLIWPLQELFLKAFSNLLGFYIMLLILILPPTILLVVLRWRLQRDPRSECLQIIETSKDPIDVSI
jgi:MFS transporter, LAT3 family, solute carrier family 43, member 3